MDSVFDADDEQEIQEIFGSSAEYWMIGFRNISIMANMSQLIKQKLNSLYQTDSEGNPIQNDLGMEQNIDSTQAVAQILKFVQYASDVQEMISKLQIHQESHPWLKQIVDILNDPNEEQFRSQFFSNFKKYYQKYSVIYKDENGVSRMKIINDNENYEQLIQEASDLLYEDKMNIFNDEYGVNGIVFDRINEIIRQIPKDEYFDITTELASLVKELFGYFGIRTGSVQEIAATLSEEDMRGIPYKIGAIINHITKNVRDYDDAQDMLKTEDFVSLAKIASKTVNFGFESMYYQNGKTYYSYVMPSFFNMFIGKLRGNTGNDINGKPIKYDKFLEDEFGQYSWFFKDGKYRIHWLEKLYESEEARSVIDHKVQLSRDGVEYKDKTPGQYLKSILSEYFYDSNRNYAWYVAPIMSNKPSEEYIKFYRYKKEDNYKKIINDSLFDVAMQEIDRIVAVRKREKTIKDSQKIKNFDGKQGKRFCFMSFLNGMRDIENYIEMLVNMKDGQAVDDELYTKITKLINDAIDRQMIAEVRKTKQQMIDYGVLV